MSTIHDVAALLAAEGLGVLAETMFMGRLPEDPDEATAVLEYPGGAPLRSHSNAPGISIRLPHLQVVCRSLDYATAADRAERAYYLLNGITNTYVGGTKYLSMRPLSDPAPQFRDGRERIAISFNVECMREG